MSAYQFYEFKAVDKALTPKEKEIISGWSSRTEATSSGAIFEYHYSDFKRDELEVVKEYFDAMFYIANWGTRRLIFKIPNEFIDVKKVRQYCADGLEIYDYENYVIIDFWLEDEEVGGWIEGDGILSSLITLRQDIINGDYRSLYLFWLKVSTEDVKYDCGVVDGDSEEPDVPNGLNNLNGALMEFVDIFYIYKDTIDAAAQTSGPIEKAEENDFVTKIENLSDSEKNAWLLRLVNSEPMLSEKIKRKLIGGKIQTGSSSKRTIKEICDNALTITNNRKELEKKEREEQRLLKLKKIESKKEDLWQEVYSLIDKKNTKAYEEAIKILKSLKELAVYKQELSSYKEKVEVILQQYNRLSGLKSRIENAKLLN